VLIRDRQDHALSGPALLLAVAASHPVMLRADQVHARIGLLGLGLQAAAADGESDLAYFRRDDGTRRRMALATRPGRAESGTAARPCAADRRLNPAVGPQRRKDHDS
jgi:hypothetical protein